MPYEEAQLSLWWLDLMREGVCRSVGRIWAAILVGGSTYQRKVET